VPISLKGGLPNDLALNRESGGRWIYWFDIGGENDSGVFRPRRAAIGVAFEQRHPTIAYEYHTAAFARFAGESEMRTAARKVCRVSERRLAAQILHSIEPALITQESSAARLRRTAAATLSTMSILLLLLLEVLSQSVPARPEPPEPRELASDTYLVPGAMLPGRGGISTTRAAMRGSRPRIRRRSCTRRRRSSVRSRQEASSRETSRRRAIGRSNRIR
jgi:hypothetical protein